MSDMTIVQLMASHRTRDFRGDHTPGGIGGWLATFLAAVLAVSFLASLIVTRLAILVLGLVCRRIAKSRPAERCANTSASIVDL
jgi:hypothetical protein